MNLGPNERYDGARLSLFARAVLGRLLTLVLAAGGLLAGVVLTLYLQERGHEASLLQQQGRQQIAQELEFLTGEIGSVRSDVLYLAEQEPLQRFLVQEGAQAALSREYVLFATRRTVYDQIRFLDTTGKEVIRVNYRDGQAEVVPDEQLQAKADRYYYRDALKLKPGEVFVSDFDLNVEHGEIEQPLEPVLRFLTPVLDDAGTTRGLLALNYSGEHLVRRRNELPLPGSTLLVNSEGHYIRGPNLDDAWGWLLGHSRTFPRYYPAAWRRITGKFEGQFSTAEGMFTFRRVSFSQFSQATGGIPVGQAPTDAPLILVAYVPPDLQYASSNKLLRQLMWMYAGAMILLVTFGWYWARSAAIRKLQASSIMDSEARLRTLSDQLLTAQEQERRSISREMHDELGQQVTAISLDLQSAKRQSDPTRARSLLERAIEETDHLLKSVHEVASRVRPSVLDDLGLSDAIESLASEISQRSGVVVTTKLDFDGHSVPQKIGENVYRIVQEGLTNVVKHAQAQRAAVTIELDSDHLRMTVQDHGVGFNPQQRDVARLGILGMQERAELLGGQFEVSSGPGTGTRIDVSIPLQNGRTSAAP